MEVIVMKRNYKYKVIKHSCHDEGAYERTFTIGFFPSKKSAMKFCHDKDNLDWWKSEYKKTTSMISMDIDIETWNGEDMVNSEMVFIFQ